jgi:D-inositol-3-phosphate glycosyltransferase
MVSMHTSPLEQPGTGDAGGMNVYVVELARQLAARGTEVEVFTRATSSALPPAVPLSDGVLVRHVPAGPYEGLAKEDLPGQMCAFAAGVMRTEARHAPGWYDLVHSHYWLSGQVGWLASDRWHVPLVHSAHTLAKVKNAHLAAGDAPEPPGRVIGEEQVVAAADALVANTEDEARDLVTRYDAEPGRVHVAQPGVDLEVFSPGGPGRGRRDRADLELPADAVVLLFAGRLQPLKGADVLVRAAAVMLRADPGLRERLVVAVVGGPSGTGLERPGELADLARRLGLLDVPGVRDVVRFAPPAPRARLAQWFRAADLVAVPSHSESFGLVALEAQACGTPVVAARVGGLVTAVADGRSGLLVDGHDERAWAAALAGLVADERRRAALARGARAHAERFGWSRTADAVLVAYAAAAAGRGATVGAVATLPA